MARILFITPMWHEPLTPNDAKVCNYFVDEWKKQGHEIVIIHYRSTFPLLYYKLAKIFPKISKKICGDQCYVNEIASELKYDYNGSNAYSIPIFKYIPHGKFNKRVLEKQSENLLLILKENKFVPDIIVGHFANPTLAIITRIKSNFPYAKTGLILHESADNVSKIYKNKAEGLLNNLDTIGYRSKILKSEYQQTFNLKPNQFICYSGVSLSFLERDYTEKKWYDGVLKNFLFVGRLTKYKHPQTIAESLNVVYKEMGFSLLYIGKKELAYNSLEEYCLKNNLNNNIKFLDHINRDEIIGWYDKSDCFVMVSEKEVFGLVFLEAMSRGCITIAGNDGGMVGIIEHGKNGFLCKPGDTNALVDLINKINSLSVEEKYEISRNARKTALEFSDNNMAENYLKNMFVTE